MNLSELKNTVPMKKVTGLRKLLPANGVVAQDPYHGQVVTTLTSLSYPPQDWPNDAEDEPVFTKARPHNRRWPPILVAVTAVVMVVCLIAVGMRHSDSGASKRQ